MEALKDNTKDDKKQLANAGDYEKELLVSKEREICKNIYNERLDKIDKLDRKINYDELEFITESTNIETDFSIKKGPVAFLNDI